MTAAVHTPHVHSPHVHTPHVHTPHVESMLNPFADLESHPATFDPSWMLPDPDALPRHLQMPDDLVSHVDAAFDQAFTGPLHTMLEDIRRKLHHLVHETVQQQVKQALTQYSDQVAGCEGAVIAARRTIHEESVGVNEKFRKIQELGYQNTRERSQLQHGLAEVEKDKEKLKRQKNTLERDRTQVRADQARLKAEEAKHNADLAEVRDERKQILQWQQLLSQTEQELAAREAHNQLYGGGKGGSAQRRAKSPAARYGTPAAADSLEEARRAVEAKAPVIEKYAQSKMGRHGVAGAQAPMPLRLIPRASSGSPQPGAPQPIEERGAWQS